MRNTIAVALGLLLTASSWAQLSLINQRDASNKSTYETIFTLPIGNDDSPRYEGGQPEMLRCGPSALAVGPDGTFWIADTVANRLLQYDNHGKLLRQIALEGVTVGVRDVEVDNDGVWVLDIASIVPAIVRLTHEGKVVTRFELPKGLHAGDGLTGIALTENGEILIEQHHGTVVSRLSNSAGKLHPVQIAGYPACDGTYSILVPLLTDSDSSTGYIVRDSSDNPLIKVTVNHYLGAIRLLRVLPDRSVYVLVEEVAFGETIKVDQQVHRYDVRGKLVGMSRIPLQKQHTYVDQVAAVGPDGEVYVLLTRPDRLEVARLTFHPFLDMVLEPTTPVLTDSTQQNSDFYPASSFLTRSSMRSVAYSYVNNSCHIDDNDIDRFNSRCTPHRGVPRYLVKGINPSVSYAWGGYHLPSQFNQHMINNTMVAGNFRVLHPIPSCTAGVDCSGFVSRVWQLGDARRTTRTLPDISNSISHLRFGDALNHPDSHVILFEAHEANGFRGIESTVGTNSDRVVAWSIPWSRVNGYQRLRYRRAWSYPFLQIESVIRGGSRITRWVELDGPAPATTTVHLWSNLAQLTPSTVTIPQGQNRPNSPITIQVPWRPHQYTLVITYRAQEIPDSYVELVIQVVP